jgi:hypothetical protein
MRAPNGKLIVGTLETLNGIAGLLPDATIADLVNLDPFCEGGTRLDYDSQRTVATSQGDRIFVDEDGGRWTEDALRDGKASDGIAVLITLTESALFVSTEDKTAEDAIETARNANPDFELNDCDYMVVNNGGPQS